MLYVDKDALERAQETAQERLSEYREAVENGTKQDRLRAWKAYKEASDAWKTLLHKSFHI